MRDVGAVHGLALVGRIGIIQRETENNIVASDQLSDASTALAIAAVPSPPPYSMGLMPPA